MKRHLRYWYARIRNDFLRLVLIGPSEHQFVEEQITKLRRDPLIARLLDEHQAKMDRERQQ